MAETVLRGRRRREHERLAQAAVAYAGLGWPVCPGAFLPDRGGDPAMSGRSGTSGRNSSSGRGCSCDRIGCPAPGAHPVSIAWQAQATADPAIVGHWWTVLPDSSVILVTGRVFDVLDAPEAAGLAALAQMDRSGIAPGPVALSAGDRALFFVATRAAQSEEGEWWSCHLDCEPDTVPEITGLRWHCRDSYVLAPPSRLPGGTGARWLRPPGGSPLPDALRLLEYLADACEERTT
jgi:hypothetical protein